MGDIAFGTLTYFPAFYLTYFGFFLALYVTNYPTYYLANNLIFFGHSFRNLIVHSI